MRARTAAWIALVLLAFGVVVWLLWPVRPAASASGPPVAATVPADTPRATLQAEPARTRSRHADDDTPSDPAAEAPAVESRDAVVRGRCLLKDGSPAVGARIRAWSVSRAFNSGAAQAGVECTVGETGAFSVPGSVVGERLVVYASLAGHHTACPPDLVNAGADGVEIRFGIGGVLTGQVTGPTGEPAEGVRVRLVPAHRMRHSRELGDWRLWSVPGVWEFYAAAAVTDGSGRYRFDGVPLPKNGEPQTRVAVATLDGRDWASDLVAFETDGEQIERDIVSGRRDWIDTPLEHLLEKVSVVPAGRVLGPNETPIAGATVTYVAADATRFDTWLAAQTADDGRFEFATQTVRRGTRVEVRVAAEGFRPFRGTPGTEPMTIRLQPATRTPLPGRIRGIATGSDGTPLWDSFDVWVADESLRVRKMGAIADENGAFVLEGLEPGEWLLYLDRDDPWKTVTVSEGGESRVALRSRKDAESYEPLWTDEMADKLSRLVERHDALESALEAGTGDRETLKKELEELSKETGSLGKQWAEALPLREVTLSGLSTGAGTVVRAFAGEREWRCEAHNGTARFAGLPILWHVMLRVERPGSPPQSMVAEILNEDGTQEIEFRPADPKPR